MFSIDDVPAYADGMLSGYIGHLNPDAPVAVTFRHPVDGRLLHAVYQVTASHQGLPRVETYGVMDAIEPPLDSIVSAEAVWVPAWALAEYWLAEPPMVATVGDALNPATAGATS